MNRPAPVAGRRARALGVALALLAGACATPYRPPYSPNLVDHATLPGGLPPCEGLLLNKAYFVLCYEPQWRVVRWEAHYLTAGDFDAKYPRDSEWFRIDRDVPRELRSDSDDYADTGYDRGHMAPAGDFAGTLDGLRTTFVMSNMAPQTPELNRTTWRDVEHSVRAATAAGRGAIIYTGNLFLDDDGRPTAPRRTVGRHRVAVPTHCFKVAAIERADGTTRLYGFVLANTARRQDEPLRHYQRTVDEIEALTGVDFFPERRDWEPLEATVDPWE